MPKKSNKANKISLNELDRKIILTMINQGYLASSVLSKKLNANVKTIRRRIAKLRNQGLVKVVALTNPISLGIRGWARIGIKIEPRYLQEVAAHLADHPSVQFATLSSGTFNIIIVVLFQDVEQLNYFINVELSAIRGIVGHEVFLLTWPRKFYNFVWPSYSEVSGGDENHSLINNRQPYKLNKVDNKILEILKEDGLANPAKLKSKLNMGITTMRLYLKKLSSMGVYKLGVWVDPKILGYTFTATIGIVIDNQSAQELLSELQEETYVLVASSCIGRFNIMIAVRFPDIDTYDEFINVKLANKKGVRYVESFPHTKLFKSYIL